MRQYLDYLLAYENDTTNTTSNWIICNYSTPSGALNSLVNFYSLSDASVYAQLFASKMKFG